MSHRILDITARDPPASCAQQQISYFVGLLRMRVEKVAKTGKCKTVTDLLKEQPALKMEEFPKQFVRDAFLEMGFDASKHTVAPQLSDDQVVECLTDTSTFAKESPTRHSHSRRQ